MKYLSVCSGIEAATQAWHPLGWQPVAFSEIEKFPSAVLAHHYPVVPNWGDMTKFKEWPDADVDLLVGGTPCQSFSVAGLRKGLADPRGELMLTFGAIAQRYQPKWMVWENVPGVLSSNRGGDFGAFLGMLAELGYGFAYRILDAQFVRTRRHARAVPQRRRRVFVVGYLGDWRRAAAVLFDAESLSGNPAPRRKAGQKAAPTISARPTGGGGLGTDFDIDGGLIANSGEAAFCITASAQQSLDAETETLLAAIGWSEELTAHENVAATLQRGGEGGQHSGVFYACRGAKARSVVRRLTPIECERLQGFPDNFTAIPWRGKTPENCPDGPRYKALGNSMAVNVMEWIGERIQLVEKMA